MQRRFLISLSAAFLIIAFSPAQSIQAEGYTLKLINTQQILDINNKGEAITQAFGTIGTRLFLPVPAYGLAAGSHTLLGTDGSSKGVLAGVNDFGVVVGSVRYPDGTRDLTIWTNGVPTRVGPSDTSNIRPQEINNLGHIIGNTHRFNPPGTPETQFGFFSDGSQVVALLGDETDNCFNLGGEPLAINNSDAIVGSWFCRTESNETFGGLYLWQGVSPTKLELQDAFRLVDINDRGQILVVISTIASGEDLAIFDGGSLTMLPRLFDAIVESNRAWINDLGEVVGTARVGGGPGVPGKPRSFLWLPAANYGLPAGLNDLTVVLNLPDQRVDRVFGINNSGQIACSINDEIRNRSTTYILTPIVPTPAPILVVNSTSDESDVNPGDGVCATSSGDCTLRAAIEESNANAGVDTIKFDIPGLFPEVIRPVTAFPEITDPVVIDGLLKSTSERVEIDGRFLSVADGLVIVSGKCSIYNLDLNGFPGNGISLITGDSNIVKDVVIVGSSLAGIAIVGSSDNMIGGGGRGNNIVFNEGAGVSVQLGEGNTISQNRIYENGGLGIDLGPTGVTVNDSLDIDNGANRLVNYPIISSVIPDFGQTLLGRMEGAPNTEYVIEIFLSRSPDISIHGEGDMYLKSTLVTTDAEGFGEFSANDFSNLGQQFLTATATDPAGNTSEFSQCWPRKKIRLEQLNMDFEISPDRYVVQVYRANYDSPYHTAELLKESVIGQTDPGGFFGELVLSDLFASGDLAVGDSIKIVVVLEDSPSDPLDPRVTMDNGFIDFETSDLTFDTLTNQLIDTIILSHTTLKFNFQVSIEWDATREYIDSLRSGIRQMANYLYDVTNGQALIDTVYMVENQGRGSFTPALSPPRRAEILFVANNIQYTDSRPEFRRAVISRRFFKFEFEASNGSAAEDPTNPAHIEHWRELARVLGEQLFGLFSERYLNPRRDECNTITDLGFMAWPFPQFGDDGANSEMSSLINYLNLDCRGTRQYRMTRQSCWDHFETKFENDYGRDGIRSEISTGITGHHPGPNNYDPITGTVNLQFDAGSRVTFVGDNLVSSAFDEFWTFTDIDGAPLAGIKVHVIRPNRPNDKKMIQGESSDNGELWLVGVNEGDSVIAAGKMFSSIIVPDGKTQTVSRWVNGKAVITSALGRSAGRVTNALVMQPISGDFPLIVSAELSGTSIDYMMDVSQAFASLPSIEYLRDSLGPVSELFVKNGLQYQAVIDIGSRQEGQIVIRTLDDSLNLFSFVTSYSIGGAIDTLSVNTVVSSDASAEFEIDAINSAIDKLLVVSSPFPIIRDGLNPNSIQAGQTHALSVFPAGSLLGDNTIVIGFNPGELVSVGGAFTEPQSLKIHHWNSDSRQWQIIESEVDTVYSRVFASISETGTYAAFTTDFQTDVDNQETVILPKHFEVHQNYPNPFNPTTTIAYSLPQKADVTVTVYNILGEIVRVLAEGMKSAGRHSVIWDSRNEHGTSVASGVYLYKVEAGEFVATRKMVLLK